MKKKMKKDIINKWKDMLCSCNGKINTVKMSIT